MDNKARVQELTERLNKLIEQRNKIEFLIDVHKAEMVDYKPRKFHVGEVYENKEDNSEYCHKDMIVIEAITMDDDLDICYECEINYSDGSFDYETFIEPELEQIIKTWERTS